MDVDGMARSGSGDERRCSRLLVRRKAEMIVCKSAAELETMHRAGLVVWDVLNDFAAGGAAGRHHAGPGEVCRRGRRRSMALARRSRATAGYPCVLCASVNQEVVHGIPSASRQLERRRHYLARFRSRVERLLWRRGRHGSRGQDQARSRRSLLRVTRESLDRAIEKVRLGQSPERHFRRRAAVGRAARLFGGARVRRSRHRNQDARRAQRAQLRRARTRPAPRRGHGLRHRADGQRRRAGSEGARR